MIDIQTFGSMLWRTPASTTTIRGSDHVALQTLYFVRVTSVTDPEFRFVELVEEFGPERTEPPCNLVDAYADRCTP